MRTLPRIVLPTDESRSPGATLPKVSPSEGGLRGRSGNLLLKRSTRFQNFPFQPSHEPSHFGMSPAVSSTTRDKLLTTRPHDSKENGIIRHHFPANTTNQNSISNDPLL